MFVASVVECGLTTRITQGSQDLKPGLDFWTEIHFSDGGLDCLDHSPAWPFMSRRVCSSVVERGIADPAVAGSNPVAPFKGKNIFSPR